MKVVGDEMGEAEEGKRSNEPVGVGAELVRAELNEGGAKLSVTGRGREQREGGGRVQLVVPEECVRLPKRRESSRKIAHRSDLEESRW